MWYLYLFLLPLTASLIPEDDPHCKPNLCMNSEIHVGCFQPKVVAIITRDCSDLTTSSAGSRRAMREKQSVPER